MIKLLDFIDDGSCTQVGYDPFFTDTPGSHQAVGAKKVCANCPVAELCFRYAMQPGQSELEGVWGGATAMERRRAREARHAKRQAAA